MRAVRKALYQGGWVRDLASTSRRAENRCGHGWGAWDAARLCVARLLKKWLIKDLTYYSAFNLNRDHEHQILSEFGFLPSVFKVIDIAVTRVRASRGLTQEFSITVGLHQVLKKWWIKDLTYYSAFNLNRDHEHQILSEFGFFPSVLR
ncbi:hypothetical protein KSP39_PZI017379 [Platanthera zijinensis]|uniref:Uncharacterized protein n=1 Tax=Platanthera zijinensis TaxID=2320716 RepID=A0AAP0FZM2_9ASPA